ncbi:PAS domain-containing protein, partial [Streptomyces carpinensis]
MSEIPAKATESEDASDGARTGAGAGGAADEMAPPADAMWQSSAPGSIYDYIKVASFSIGPDGLVDQWSLRAEQLFGIPAEHAVGMDPIEAFIDPDLREQGQRKMAEILDGREWTGVVPFRLPAPAEGGTTVRGRSGLAEVYVMPTRTAEGDKAAVCIVVDVRTLRSIETDLAASQAIFGQSPFGFLLIDTDLRVRRANQRFASIFGGRPDDHRGKGVYDYLPRSEADRVSAILRRVLENGESITDMHVTGFVPDSDEPRHWSVNLYRVHSGSGRPIGIAWLGTDITARRAAAR